ncbi:hypothetical protein ACJMK2_029455, partial [Sinanodonta woodiana]
SSTNSFPGSDRQMEKQVETCAKDDLLKNEYAESRTTIQDKSCSHNIRIRDVKLSKYLRDSNSRIDHDHAQAATPSVPIVNDNTSADKDAGHSSGFRE